MSAKIVTLFEMAEMRYLVNWAILFVIMFVLSNPWLQKYVGSGIK